MSPIDGGNSDGYLRLLNDDGIALIADRDRNGSGHVEVSGSDLVLNTGAIRLGNNPGNMTGVHMSNRSIDRANKVTINDPGGSEESTGWAPGRTSSSPLDGSNADGYLRLINDGVISLESDVTRTTGRIDIANGVQVLGENVQLGPGRVSFSGAEARVAIDL